MASWTSVKTFTATTLTVADMNTYVRDNSDFLKRNIALGAPVELTISIGVVTASQTYHDIDTESDASSDELDTISGISQGDIIVLRAENASRTVILKDGTGNLELGGDIYLNDADKHIALITDGDNNLHPLFESRRLTFTANAFEYPAPGTDWSPTLSGAELAAAKAGKKCWLPLNFLKIGDSIISYKLLGDVTEAASTTLDCNMFTRTLGDPTTVASIAGASIAQITADGDFDIAATLTSAEVVATDTQYVLELQGTTATTGDTIVVIGAEVLINRLA